MPRLESSALAYIVSTGCGASSVSCANRTLSEITAQAKAANHLFPAVRTVIDIGAQFSRVSHTDGKGNVTDFVISEKCAAGSGRLLQVLARVLQVNLTELGQLSLKSTKTVEFTTNCAVFIESEIVSRIAEGENRQDIIAGVQRSLAMKAAVLAERIGAKPDFCFLGGAANNAGLAEAIKKALNGPLSVPENPQYTAALGAALIGAAQQ